MLISERESISIPIYRYRSRYRYIVIKWYLSSKPIKGKIIPIHTCHMISIIDNKALRVAGGFARCARSPGEWNEMTDVRSARRWSNIFGANRRLASAKSSMLQENNPDAPHACTYTCIPLSASFDTWYVLWSARTCFAALFRGDCAVPVLCCASLCCASLCSRCCCCRYSTKTSYIQQQKKNRKTGKKRKKRTWRKQRKRMLLSVITGWEVGEYTEGVCPPKQARSTLCTCIVSLCTCFVYLV